MRCKVSKGQKIHDTDPYIFVEGPFEKSPDYDKDPQSLHQTSTRVDSVLVGPLYIRVGPRVLRLLRGHSQIIYL